MRLLGVVIGALFILLGVIIFGAVISGATDAVPSLGRTVVTPDFLWVMAALRIVIGLVFILAASASRAPRTLRLCSASSSSSRGWRRHGSAWSV